MPPISGYADVLPAPHTRPHTAESAAPQAVQKFARQPELDALRGLLLFWMTLTHLPTLASAYANQPFGFISAAEGFVFLSALVTGKIYAAQASAGFSALRNGLWPRAARVYIYHLLLLAFAFTLGTVLAPTGHRPMLHNLLTFYFAHPVVATVSSVFLVYCPPLLDILPMYVIFLLLTPLLLMAAHRFRWRIVLILSGTLWMLAQFGLRAYVYAELSHLVGHHIPVQEMGAFDLFAWQFLWCLGIWLGTVLAAPTTSDRSFPEVVTIFALVIVIVCACLRRGWPTPIFWDGSLAVLQDKWRVAPLRLLDFAALGIVLWRFRPALKRILNTPPLPAIGMSSLQVFAAHVVFALCALALVTPHITHDSGEILHGAVAFAVVVVTLLGMFLTGILASAHKLHTPKPVPPVQLTKRRRRRRRRPRRPPAPSPI
jgi:hypothetical protein